jgi:hypothetical protein
MIDDATTTARPSVVRRTSQAASSGLDVLLSEA